MTDTLIQTQLPHWDMSPLFSSLDAADFTDAFAALSACVRELQRLFDDNDVRKPQSSEVDDATVRVFEDVVSRLNDLEERARCVRAYVHSFVATEARNDTAQARMSELQNLGVDMDKLWKRFVAWVGGLDTDALVASSSIARTHEFRLRKAREEAAHQMSEAE